MTYHICNDIYHIVTYGLKIDDLCKIRWFVWFAPHEKESLIHHARFEGAQAIISWSTCMFLLCPFVLPLSSPLAGNIALVCF